MEASAATTEATGHPVKGFDLKDLEFGHKAPGGGINDRVTGRDAEVDALAESIKADGLLQNIAVWDTGSAPYYVIAGNRRLAALRIIHKAGKAIRNVTVMCVAIDAMDIADALAKAAASNMHIPPHPVDAFETFARLAASGMTAATIAKRYGIEDVKGVERSLALGRLAPEIRSAWRAGKLQADCAKVFTLEPDHEKQVEIYEKLKKGHGLYPHAIRQAITGNTDRLFKLLKLVGEDAYEKGGGVFRVDLFPEPHNKSGKVPQDIGVLETLATLKLDAKCEALRKDGWAWAEHDTETRAEYQWTSISGNSRTSKLSKADKAKSGCIVRVAYDGALDIYYGLIRPKDAKKVAAGEAPKADKPKKAKADPKALSGALVTRLNTTLMVAMQDMLHNEAISSRIGLHPAAFNMLAGLIQPERHQWSPVKPEDCAVLRDAGGTHAARYLLKHFDAKDYFASIPAALTLKLLATTELGKRSFKQKIGKAELVDAAVKAQKAADWLPVQLQPAGNTKLATTKAKRSKRRG